MAISLLLLTFGLAAGDVLAAAPPRLRGLICRQYDKVFELADTNRDGFVDQQEVYEMVLKVCIQLNRQAPIKAPSRKSVMAVYQRSDKNRDGNLNKQEFQELAAVIFIGGIGRVMAHKFISLVAGPLLAAEIIRRLDGKAWLIAIGRRIVPSSLHDRILKKSVCMTVLTVFFVTSLGSWVFGLIDMLGDALYGVVEYDSSRVSESPARRSPLMLRGGALARHTHTHRATGQGVRPRALFGLIRPTERSARPLNTRRDWPPPARA
jgi:hypothetical protein